MITTWIDILVIRNAVYSLEPDVVRPGKTEDSHMSSQLTVRRHKSNNSAARLDCTVFLLHLNHGLKQETAESCCFYLYFLYLQVM